MAENDFFQRMCKQAQDEIATGERGWKDADTNTLLLACFGLLSNHLAHTISRPLWFVGSAITVAVVSLIVEHLLF